MDNITFKRLILATVAPVSHRTAEENLGIGYIAAILRGLNYKVTIIDGWLAGMPVNQIADSILEYKDIFAPGLHYCLNA